MNQIKVYAKTLAAFIAGVVGNMIVSLINGGAAWPQTGAEWLQWAVTSFGAAIAASLARNKITQKQLDKDPNVIGGTVVPDSQVIKPAAPPVAGQYKNPWT